MADLLEPNHFFDQLHQKIIETASKLIASGKVADPTTIRTFFEKAEMIDSTPTKTTEKETGRTIRVGELPSSSLSRGAVDLLYKALRKEGI